MKSMVHHNPPPTLSSPSSPCPFLFIYFNWQTTILVTYNSASTRTSAVWSGWRKRSTSVLNSWSATSGGGSSTFAPFVQFPPYKTTISYLLPFLKPPTPCIPPLLSMTWLRKNKAIRTRHNLLLPLHVLTSPHIIVDRCFLKPGLWASCISTTGELVRNASSWVPLKTYWIKFWGWGPAICAFISAPGDSDEA